MAASQTVIANLALGHLGVGTEIANLATESSQEARTARRFFSQVQEELISSFAWPFSGRFATLALVEETPTAEWAFSYRYPSDALYLRRILSGTRNDSRQSRVPFKILSDDDGLLLYTDMEDAEIEYTSTATDVLRWPSDFVKAFAYLLAAYMAPTLTRGDPTKLGDRCMALHMAALNDAAASALNEQQPDESVLAEQIRVREGGLSTPWQDVGPSRS